MQEHPPPHVAHGSASAPVADYSSPNSNANPSNSVPNPTSNPVPLSISSSAGSDRRLVRPFQVKNSQFVICTRVIAPLFIHDDFFFAFFKIQLL